MYKVLIERRAEKDLNILEYSTRERIIGSLLKIRFNPRSNAKKIQGSRNTWRIRISDWRVIYEINDRKKEVKVYRIKHRSKAY